MLGAALEEQRKEGEWIEGIAIWVAVAIVIMVGELHSWMHLLLPTHWARVCLQQQVEQHITRQGRARM